MMPEKDGKGLSAQAQKTRGIVVDHAEASGEQATLYLRTWFSEGTRLRGGRPCVHRVVKEGGSWKIDLRASVALTAGIAKGIDEYGLYDGTEGWWTGE